MGGFFPFAPGKSCMEAVRSLMVSSMRITGPGMTGTTSTRKSERKGASAATGDFTKRLEGAEQTMAASGAAPGAAGTAVGAVGAIDALLALQGAGDATSGRSKGLAHGHRLLDLLEEVRRGILLGAIPRAQLDQLARLARSRREAFTDPVLSGILDEIELRAEVELAKLDRDRDD
ncbi:MAG: flagellar assembly protein FliX [Rhodothalassiaceae bacterium]